MNDPYEELARLIGQTLADRWMKIIVRRRAQSGNAKEVKLAEVSRRPTRDKPVLPPSAPASKKL